MYCFNFGGGGSMSSRMSKWVVYGVAIGTIAVVVMSCVVCGWIAKEIGDFQVLVTNEVRGFDGKAKEVWEDMDAFKRLHNLDVRDVKVVYVRKIVKRGVEMEVNAATTQKEDSGYENVPLVASYLAPTPVLAASETRTQQGGCQMVQCLAAGEAGDNGYDGYDGMPGVDGVPGLDGLNNWSDEKVENECADCPAGSPGPKGVDGGPGERGLDGDSGLRGERGREGNEGPRGPKGDNGDRGEPGEEGLPGRAGRDKSKKIGSPGREGNVGMKGSRGEPGRKGESGEGIPGIPGKEGRPGRDGNPGPPGPRGDKGIDGISQADALYCPCTKRRFSKVVLIK